jgi:hypothetical protein
MFESQSHEGQDTINSEAMHCASAQHGIVYKTVLQGLFVTGEGGARLPLQDSRFALIAWRVMKYPHSRRSGQAGEAACLPGREVIAKTRSFQVAMEKNRFDGQQVGIGGQFQYAPKVAEYR